MSGGAAITSTSTSVAGKITGLFGAATGKIGGFFKTNIGGAIGALGAAFAATKIIGFFGDAVSAASELSEATSKAGVVFGESAGKVEDFGETAAESIGQSKLEAIAAAGAFGNMFKTIGFSGDAAADMSIRMVKLASDMASFNDEDPSVMLDKLRSGLAGEAEPLRQFGVLISDATVKTFAYSNGIAAAGSELTEAEKVQARYGLILQQTANQQGDFARTADGLANTGRSLNAQMADLSAEIGEMLLPVMVDLAHFAVDVLVPALKGVIEFAKGMGEAIGEGADIISDAVRGIEISMGAMGQKVEDEAERLGLNVDEMKRAYATAVNDMGLEGQEAMDAAIRMVQGLPIAITDAARQSLANWKQEDLGGGIAANVAAGDDILRRGIQSGIAEPTAEELAQVKEDAEAAARAMTADYAATIADAGDDVQQAWEAFLAGAETEMSETARIADLNAKLTATSLTDALNSEDPYRRAAAVAMKQDILDELALLESGAIDHAVRTGQSLPDALDSTREAARLAAQRTQLAATREFDLGQIPASSAGTRTGTGYATAIGNQYTTATGKARGVVGGAVYEFGRGNAASGGASLVNSWLNGMWNAYWARRRATIDAIAADAGYVFGRSLPRTGPLKGGLRSGGFSVGESWVEGLVSALRQAPGRVRLPLSAALPVMRPLAMSAAGADIARAMVTNSSSSSSIVHLGGITIHAPNFRGGPEDVEQLSRSLATQIRMRASSAFR